MKNKYLKLICALFLPCLYNAGELIIKAIFFSVSDGKLIIFTFGSVTKATIKINFRNQASCFAIPPGLINFIATRNLVDLKCVINFNVNGLNYVNP